MNIYFKNIRAINPAQDLDEVLNLWIKDGIIVHCSSQDASINDDTEVLNADNWVCSPGLYDMHVHFREPGFEYKEDIDSGAESAANGGFTGVCVMPNTDPTIDNITVVNFIKQRAKDLLVDVGISASITQGREGKHLSPMLELADYGVLLFTDDGSCVMDSEVMKRAFDYASTRDLLISQHCEDHTLTKDYAMNEGAISGKLGLKGYPGVAEEIIVGRDVKLSEYCGNRRYHVQHISTIGAIYVLRDAKSRGLRVSSEATPHHFTNSEDELVSYNPNLKMNPPLRTKDDIKAVIEGLKDGTIDCIVSDHAPHALHEKDVEYEKAPQGIIGLETALGLTLTNLIHKNIISLNDMINKMSVNPRKLLNLKEISISVDEKANLSIFSPDEEWIVDSKKFKSKAKNSPYIGIKLKGKPKYTINNNRIYKSDL
ncbi:dihydroorotase [Bacteroidota bacterium]